ncbi:MAG: cupin [Acidobacteria bacterium]|nr:MAG: cupin [Acidobacteriota bacterium]
MEQLDINGNVSKIFKSEGRGRWRHIQSEPYKRETSSYKNVTRFELIGKRGESPLFHTRYFEIESGGYSTLEVHQHEHVVYVIKGSGSVRIGCRVHVVSVGDLIYISPGDAHQFLNHTEEGAFGFICMVNADRDKPVPVAGGEACAICE